MPLKFYAPLVASPLIDLQGAEMERPLSDFHKGLQRYNIGFFNHAMVDQVTSSNTHGFNFTKEE